MLVLFKVQDNQIGYIPIDAIHKCETRFGPCWFFLFSADSLRIFFVRDGSMMDLGRSFTLHTNVSGMALAQLVEV